MSKAREGPRLHGRTVLGLVAVQLAAACASVPDAPEKRNGALAESFYVVAPWAQQEPVNITARFEALNASLAAVQTSVDSYYAGLRAQADAHNSRVFLQAELAASQAAERRRAAEIQPARALPAQGDFKTGKIDPKSITPYKENVPPWAGFEAGTAVAGYARAWEGWAHSKIRDAAEMR